MKDKIAFISGSTSGIGLATAKQLLLEGCKVIFSGKKNLDSSELSKITEGNSNTTYIKCDITSKSDIEETSKVIKEKFGKLDYLVCNAGIMPKPCGIDDITEDVVNKTIDTNLKGTFWTLKILGGLINETSENGSIVCITSVDGLIGEPYAVIYSATKAGIISLTKSFSRYFKNPLTRVNAIAPGLIDTPLTKATGEDPSWTTDLSIIKRIGKSEEVANGAIYLLSEKASFVTGQVLTIDGGFTLK